MKRVLVSGGSRGIGRAITEEFAALGYSVSFIYNNSDTEAYNLQSNTAAVAIKADLSKPDECERAAKAAIDALSGIDILINCAGISEIKMFSDISNDNLEHLMNVNFKSAFILSREISKDMVKRKYGKIINIGSMWGERGASCEVHYSASKAALEGFTKALAKELGPSGITVNCVRPGFIKTDMTASFSEDVLSEIRDATPLSRLGEPRDVAHLVRFLASDDASFITAQCIGVDGGIIL